MSFARVPNAQNSGFSKISELDRMSLNRTILHIPQGRRKMDKVTRRSFVSTAAAGMATLGLFTGASSSAEAQLVWKTSDWKLAEFEKLVHHPARIKQVWDVVNIGGGKFLSNIKNALNGLRFGFGIPENQNRFRCPG